MNSFITHLWQPDRGSSACAQYAVCVTQGSTILWYFQDYERSKGNAFAHFPTMPNNVKCGLQCRKTLTFVAIIHQVVRAHEIQIHTFKTDSVF